MLSNPEKARKAPAYPVSRPTPADGVCDGLRDGSHRRADAGVGHDGHDDGQLAEQGDAGDPRRDLGVSADPIEVEDSDEHECGDGAGHEQVQAGRDHGAEIRDTRDGAQR